MSNTPGVAASWSSCGRLAVGLEEVWPGPDGEGEELADSSGPRSHGSGVILVPPRYLFRGSAMGLPAFGSGMTSPLVVHDPGGGVTGPGGIDGPLMRGLSTGFTQAGRALRNVDVAARCRSKAGRKRDGGACT